MSIRLLFSMLSLTVLLTFSACDDRDGEDTVEQQAIRNQSKAYEKAFNQGNAAAIANLWAEDAMYTDLETGVQLKGRKAIHEDFEVTFEKNRNSNIEIYVNSIEILAKNKAVEMGTAAVSRDDQESILTAYKAFYENQKGDWLLTEVREVEYELPTSNYENLKKLGWLVGEWVDEDEDTKIITKFEWNDNHNYLTQLFTVTTEGQIIQEGKQIIAWDPAIETIRSWIFDSDGGFGEGTWLNEHDTWTVETSFTLSDGRLASAINTYTKVGDNSYTWESTGREVAGEMLPSIGPVIVEKIIK